MSSQHHHGRVAEDSAPGFPCWRDRSTKEQERDGPEHDAPLGPPHVIELLWRRHTEMQKPFLRAGQSRDGDEGLYPPRPHLEAVMSDLQRGRLVAAVCRHHHFMQEPYECARKGKPAPQHMTRLRGESDPRRRRSRKVGRGVSARPQDASPKSGDFQARAMAEQARWRGCEHVGGTIQGTQSQAVSRTRMALLGRGSQKEKEEEEACSVM